MMNHSSSNLSNGPATITPNTLNAITGVLSQSNSNNSPHPLSVSHVPPQATTNGNQNGQSYYNQSNGYSNQAANAANTAANGLFLLSQAHQELTKREAEARAGGNTNGSANSANNSAPPPAANKRGTKRKNTIDNSVSPAPVSKGKRSKPDTTVNTRSRRITVSPDGFGEEEEEEDDYDDDDLPMRKNGTKSNGRGSKVPMTEEEKRKNFLERNRQAALKCRQRKKAWLAQLQAKNEYLENENERLTNALVSSREEISRLSAIVGAQGVSNSTGLPSVPAGTGAPAGGGTAGGAPISVNVSLPGPVPTKTVAAPVGGGGGRGYGY